LLLYVVWFAKKQGAAIVIASTNLHGWLDRLVRLLLAIREIEIEVEVTAHAPGAFVQLYNGVRGYPERKMICAALESE